MNSNHNKNYLEEKNFLKNFLLEKLNKLKLQNKPDNNWMNK